MNTHRDYYEILQVSPSAEREVIEAAYRRLARKYHPDVDGSPDSTERMRLLNEAYETLHDDQRRRAYDRQRSTGSEDTTEQTGRRGSSDFGKTAHREANEPATTGNATTRSRRLVILGIGSLILALVGLILLSALPGGSSSSVDSTAEQDSASDFTNFIGSWSRHGFGLTISEHGEGTAQWRVYKWCSSDPLPPCDAVSGNMIIAGGYAGFAFFSVEGLTAKGEVLYSADQTWPAGSIFELRILPYDLADLRRGSTVITLCGPDFVKVAPTYLVDSAPCGA